MDLQERDEQPPPADSAERHRGNVLRIRRCLGCGSRLAPVIITCTSCQSTTLEWIISSGEGSIVSWKVVHRPAKTDSAEWETSTVAIVELDDGPWIYTTIDGAVPPPSGGPVRVMFKPEMSRDQFPVFTIAATDGVTDVSVTIATPPREKSCDSAWVNSCLHQCDFLAASHSLDTEAKALIRFAIQRAPSGGASAEELLAVFGLTRWRFVQTVRETLCPRRSDNRIVRASKRNLMDALAWGWRIYPDSSTAHG